MDKKHPGGRPPKYKDHVTCVAVSYMAAAGLTDKQMAAQLDMGESTFYAWKNEHKEFLEALKEGKDKSDSRVEKSLYKRALGYSYTAQKVVVVSEGNGMGSSPEIVKYKEHVPASTTAQIFWLKNRKPSVWRDKQTVEHEGEINGHVTLGSDRLAAFKEIKTVASQNLAEETPSEPETDFDDFDDVDSTES